MRESAEARLGRLLLIVPWVVERGGATVDEIAERFDLSRASVLKELSLAQCYEVPPYGPDHTLGIVVVDDEVLVEPGGMLDRPLRLGPREAFGLLAAGRAALDAVVDHDLVLASALAKLEAALGDRVPVHIDLDRPQLVDDLRAAATERRTVEIDYWSAGRDAGSTRRLDPMEVMHRDGAWYVTGHCHLADELRTFRIDRIDDLRPTEDRFAEAAPVITGRFEPADDATEVTLLVTPAGRWVAENHPTRSVVERPDGRVEIVLAVASEVFLEGVLLQLGADGEVVGPPSHVDTGATVARRVLERYA